MLLNVGSGGGAAAAPTGGAGGAAAETAPEEAKEEKKEEGTMSKSVIHNNRANAISTPRERGVGRRHGFWAIRLEHAPFEGSKRNSYFSIARMHLAWVNVTFKTFQNLPAYVRISAFEAWLNQYLVSRFSYTVGNEILCEHVRQIRITHGVPCVARSCHSQHQRPYGMLSSNFEQFQDLP